MRHLTSRPTYFSSPPSSLPTSIPSLLPSPLLLPPLPPSISPLPSLPPSYLLFPFCLSQGPVISKASPEPPISLPPSEDQVFENNELFLSRWWIRYFLSIILSHLSTGRVLMVYVCRCACLCTRFWEARRRLASVVLQFFESRSLTEALPLQFWLGWLWGLPLSSLPGYVGLQMCVVGGSWLGI